MTVVDAHLHLWDPAVLEYDWLRGEQRRRHGPDELRRADPSDAVERVFVQAECRPDQSAAEVAWVESIAERARVIGIVAQVPLERGARELEAPIADLAARPSVVGVRRVLQSERAGFSTSAGFVEGARLLADAGLVFDACVRAAQLADVVALADAVPELLIVLDHLGKPEMAGGPDARWQAAIGDLARRPSVSVKLSGLPAEVAGPWTRQRVEPYFDACLRAFGPDRLLYGSDWPVSGPIAPWRDAVTGWAADRLGIEGVEAVMGGNARRVYGLGRRTSDSVVDGTQSKP